MFCRTFFQITFVASSSSKAKSSSPGAVPASPAPALEDDRQSLDFTDFFASPAPESPASESEIPIVPAVSPASASPAPRLELSLEPLIQTESHSAHIEMVPPISVAPLPKPFPCVALDNLIEKSALLFSEGQPGEARKVLEKEIEADQAIEEAWPLLFDLYRLSGEQGRFEQLALDFAQRFEKSPPTWHAETEAHVATTQDGRASVSLTGMLNARCAPQFAKLAEVAKTRSALRLDLSKIQDVDSGGAQLLLELMRQLKKSTCELSLANTDALVALIKKRVISGERKNEPLWLLLLEIHQRLGQQEPFDDLALDYAITFEVSPPSWEIPKEPAASTLAPEGETGDVTIDFEQRVDAALGGEILNADSSRFNDILQILPAPGDDDIIIDVAQLNRIDQTSALVLAEILETRPPSERRIRLANASHLVAAMLDMAGIGQLALVERQKF